MRTTTESAIAGGSYQARIPIYPRSVKGRFRTLKWAILALAYGVYFLLPWVPWARTAAPDQAVLFDIEQRRFYLFDLVVHAQDIFWLAGLLVIAALLLFFVTGIAGRLFCGYFCFQTLWTDVYILIERLVQGERPARVRLGKAPWSAQKVLELGLTHLLWVSVALLTGMTFTLYWGDASQLLAGMLAGTAPFPAYAAALFLTATTYTMAGPAREQVCTYMCPYARFQSAMFDADTLLVAYDRARGEGQSGRARLARGLKSRGERREHGAGDCVDCGYCVQVCPTGIDIRDGLQIECIACALCIDACDTIMGSLGWPRGLIRYASQRALEGGRTRLLRPKTIGYGVVLIAAVSALAWSIVSASRLDMAVRQVRQPLYVVLSDRRIQNSYELKVNNKSGEALPVRITLQGLPRAELDLGGFERLVLEPEQRLRLRVHVRMPPAAGAEPLAFRFVLSAPQETGVAPVQAPAYFSLPREPGGAR